MRLSFWIVLPLLLVQNPSPPPAPASLEGIVVSFGTNEPIPNADVELRRIVPAALLPANLSPDIGLPELRLIVQTAENLNGNPTFAGGPNSVEALRAIAREAVSLTATTATTGRFSFRNVPPGEYRLYATRSSGYIPGEYGQRSPVGVGTPLTLAAGQVLSDVRLAMSPTGSISGRIVDGDGDPVVGARVNALRVAYQEGERILLN